jgi:flagellar hook-basal body complex protein FliE
MDIKATNAALSYSEALSRAAKMGAGGARGVEAGTPESSFSDFLSQFADSSVAALEKSEKMTMQGAEGKVDLVELVSAVSNAELTLDMVVALRDKVMAAYQEIIKMPV